MRSFVIRKVVEGIGGDARITGCGTQVCIWILPRQNCSLPPVWNILYTLMVAVICWPFCGARRNTSISAGPFADIWKIVALSNYNTDCTLAECFFANTKFFFDKPRRCLAIWFFLLPSSLLQSRLVCYPAFDQRWKSFRGTNNSGKCFDSSLVKVWRWKLIRYHAPDERKIVFCNDNPWVQTMVVSNIPEAVSHHNQNIQFAQFLSCSYKQVEFFQLAGNMFFLQNCY